MLERIRGKLEALLGPHAEFPPPVLEAPDHAAHLRADLVRFWHDDRERYLQFFLHQRPLLLSRRDRPFFETLAAAGLAARVAPTVYLPCVRLFPLYGKYIATDLLSYDEPDQVFSLMLEQVYFVRNTHVRAGDDVLELCLGSGVNALFAADRARRVTGVELSPRALAFARFNHALNPPPVPMAIEEGSLFEPLDPAQRFDLILVNPPFEPVLPGATHYRHSDGGPDGLDVTRRVLADAPAHLAPEGRFEIITWSPGDDSTPLLLDEMQTAFPHHRLTVQVLATGDIEEHLATFKERDGYEDWRSDLKARGLDTAWFVFARAAPSSTPGVEIEHPDSEVAACLEIVDEWSVGRSTEPGTSAPEL